MKAITHRELRNSSGEILRRAEAGETLQVTNNGRAVAVIGPAGGDLIAQLVARGEARAALTDAGVLRTIKRAVSDQLSSELIRDARGSW